MKRIFTKALCLVCAGALALSLAACGGKADSAASSTASSSALGSASDYDYQNFNYSDGLDEKGYWEGIRALDYVTLPEDFASVAIKRSDVEPTSEEVEKQISDLLSQYSSTEHITDRAAADGDTVNINYVGSVNNVEFTGGSAENYDLTLGSGTFIDGFEDQIIGHKPGETFDVNVTFPDGYSDSTDASGNAVKLSGQKAEGRLPRLAVEEVEGAEEQSRKAHGYLALLELHPAVSGEVSGGGGADIVQPVLTGDAVHLGLFAEGVLKKRLLRVGGSAELTVHLGVVESLFAAAAGRRRLLPLGGKHSTAAAAGFLIPQGALAAGRTGAELALLVGELPLVAGGVGRAVDALAQLLVADAVIRRAAVGADHDVILKCEGLAAALTRTAIVFWHNILQ